MTPTAMLVRTASDSVFRCAFGPATAGGRLSLQCSRGKGGELHWTRAQDTLRLDGVIDGAPVATAATLVDRASYPLMRSRFRWMSN
jgi:hypothetical protein